MLIENCTESELQITSVFTVLKETKIFKFTEEKEVIANLLFKSLTSNVFNNTNLLDKVQVRYDKRLTSSVGTLHKHKGKCHYLIKLSDQLNNTVMRLMNSLVYMMSEVIIEQNPRLRYYQGKWMFNTLKCYPELKFFNSPPIFDKPAYKPTKFVCFIIDNAENVQHLKCNVREVRVNLKRLNKRQIHHLNPF